MWRSHGACIRATTLHVGQYYDIGFDIEKVGEALAERAGLLTMKDDQHC
jgi:hypothetical protein